MKKGFVVLSILIAVAALAMLMLSVASAAPSAPAQWVTFTKTASNPAPRVGEIFTYTLFFAPTGVVTQNTPISITDVNPAPSYLRIISDPSTIQGNAAYSEALDAILWGYGNFGGMEYGWLIPGSLGHTISFQVEVTGIPTSALSTGLVVTNTATMVGNGPVPPFTESAQTDIRIMPLRLSLPLVLRNYTP